MLRSCKAYIAKNVPREKLLAWYRSQNIANYLGKRVYLLSKNLFNVMYIYKWDPVVI